MERLILSQLPDWRNSPNPRESQSHGYGAFTFNIEDDFDLEKITSCGQCFRARKFDNGTYRFITGGHVIYIRPLAKSTYKIYCELKSWELIWRNYFDLSRNYESIRKNAAAENDFVRKAIDAGTGIRILRQDAWEMLITFIISQRKSIPAISKAVESLSEKYGQKLVTGYETVYTFPTPQELVRATEEELRSCGLGYRTAYVMDAAGKIASGSIDLSALASYDDDALFTELLKIHGVGKKVANCVCLFGYGRSSSVPVDVWIARAIDEECQGHDPFAAFGNAAGIIQQYVFYYERNVLPALRQPS